jgi:hypothetical protein
MPPPPPPTGLDPQGDYSIGTVSIPDAPDLGLENGYSFGSVMSMDPQQHRPQHRSSDRSSHSSVPMPTGLQGQEYSFGSIVMSDAEQRRVEAHMKESYHRSSNIRNRHPPAQALSAAQQEQAHHHQHVQQHHHHHYGHHRPPTHEYDEQVPQPVDFGLEDAGLSAGSLMSYGTIQALAGMDTSNETNRKAQMVSFGGKTVVPAEQQQSPVENETYNEDSSAPPPVDFGLEPAGLSTGSMMSVGTIKLEDVGTSFGSVMSFTTKSDDAPPEAVDGGLGGIGTSFGSMSLAGGGDNGDGGPPPPPPPAAAAASTLQRQSFEPPEPLNEAVPTLLHQQRSRGDLLDCGDSDSEDERQSAQSSLQKSADWEKLKATFEAQMKSGQASSDSPPSLYGTRGHDTTVLPVAVGRSGSNEYGNMPPPPARKQGEE